jgi:hypothetical protein
MREHRARRWSRLRLAYLCRWRLFLAACSLLAAGCASGGFSASISDDELPLEEASPYPTAVAKPGLESSPDLTSRIERDPEPVAPPVESQAPESTSAAPATDNSSSAAAAPIPIQQPPATPLAVVPAALRSSPQPPSEIAAPVTPAPSAEAALPPIVSASDLPPRQPAAIPANTPPSPPAEAATNSAPPASIEPPAAAAIPSSASLLPEERLAAIAQQRDVLIAMLEEDLRARVAVATDTKSPDTEVGRLEQQLRLLYAMAERPDDAVRPIEVLSEPEREAYKQLLFGVSTWLAPEEARRAPLRNARVLRSLRDATRELAAASKLDLRNVTFCERVESFGWFTQFTRNEFQPKQQVLLYVEVDNFVAQEKGPHSFETELQGHYQIFDSRENIVAERQLPLDREVCRNYRRDYFLAYPIFLPESIAPGRYRLELTIEDHKAGSDYQGRKFGQAAIEFSIR